jgi:hypothetical protein
MARATQAAMLLLLLLLGARPDGGCATMAEAATATSTTASSTFEQLTSTRMYLANTKISPRVESWPVLHDIVTTPQLLGAAGGGTGSNYGSNASAVWILVPGKLFLLDEDGRTRAVAVGGDGLPSGGAVRGAACGGAAVLVAASARELVVLSCRADTAACAATKRVALPAAAGSHGTAAPAVACDGTAAWVAPARAGCVFSVDLAAGAVTRHDESIGHGNVTALAAARGRVAVGTDGAVFDEFDARAGTFGRHTDVGDLIDAPASALAVRAARGL